MERLRLLPLTVASWRRGKGRARTRRILATAGALTLLVLVIGGGWLLFDRVLRDPAEEQKEQPADRISTSAEEEQRYGKVTEKNLRQGDVVSYITPKLQLVGNYLAAKDYADAERILDEIKSKVAEKDRPPAYYIYRYSVDQYKKDIPAQKADLEALIPILKRQKRDVEADYYQGQLNSLNGGSPLPPAAPPPQPKNVSPVQ